MEKDENIVKEAEEEAKRIHDLETANTAVNAPKKSGSGKNLLIAVLIVLLLVAVCVILFVTGVFGRKNKNDNKNNGKENVVENKENTNTENVVENIENTNTENVEKPVDTPKYKEEQLTVDSPEVKKLFDIFSGQLAFENIPGADDYRMAVAATFNAIDEKDIVLKTCGDLDNYSSQGYMCNTGDLGPLMDPTTYELSAEGIEIIKKTSVRTITVEKFNETYKKLFGKELTEVPRNVPFGCFNLLYYDDVNKLYALDFIYPNTGCEVTPVMSLSGITQENGNLVLHMDKTHYETNTVEKIDLGFKFDETTGNYIYSYLNVIPE